MKPAIQFETVEKLAKALNSTADLDDMIHILKSDKHWEFTSTEQCERFLAIYLTKLNEICVLEGGDFFPGWPDLWWNKPMKRMNNE